MSKTVKHSFKDFININDLPANHETMNKELIEELREELDRKKREIKNLESRIANSICIIFSSKKDTSNTFPLSCDINDDFKTLEKKIYAKYVEYEETEKKNAFSVRGNPIDKTKTLKDNGIRDGDTIQLDY